MSTFLFDQIIFGPVNSRRLGVSLGVNLLPTDSKVCSFDCIYCECGWTPKKRVQKAVLPSRELVKQKLEEKLIDMIGNDELPDVITFAGNGEPTSVSYTHLRAHETRHDLVCRLLLEK